MKEKPQMERKHFLFRTIEISIKMLFFPVLKISKNYTFNFFLFIYFQLNNVILRRFRDSLSKIQWHERKRKIKEYISMLWTYKMGKVVYEFVIVQVQIFVFQP